MAELILNAPKKRRLGETKKKPTTAVTTTPRKKTVTKVVQVPAKKKKRRAIPISGRIVGVLSSSKPTQILQAATVIAKTTQTLVGEIDCARQNFLTLWIDYVKGDETGLNVYVYFRRVSSGTNYQDATWSATAGTKTATANMYQMTASANRYLTIDVEGIDYVAVYQGGSNNDGTPTGTLAVAYTAKS
jgi:hypothetical protein